MQDFELLNQSFTAVPVYDMTGYILLKREMGSIELHVGRIDTCDNAPQHLRDIYSYVQYITSKKKNKACITDNR